MNEKYVYFVLKQVTPEIFEFILYWKKPKPLYPKKKNEVFNNKYSYLEIQ